MVFLHSLIGTFVRSRRALAQYAYWLWWAVGVNIALDVWNLVTIFRTDKDDLVKDCVNGSTDQNVIDTCNKTVDSTWWKVVVIASMVLGLLIQCCESGCHCPHPPRSATSANQILIISIP